MGAVNAARVETITLAQAVRDAVANVSSQRAQAGDHHNGGRDAVDVVVAVDKNSFVTIEGREEAVYGRLHLDEIEGGMETIERRIKVGLHVLMLGDSPGRQHPRRGRRKAEARLEG